jgi:hypothetical protein
VFGLQGEEKAGKRGMKTVNAPANLIFSPTDFFIIKTVNPHYTTWIAHKDPSKCPLGAFAFYLHDAHNVKDLTGKLNIDWLLNNSWRQVRLVKFVYCLKLSTNRSGSYMDPNHHSHLIVNSAYIMSM